MKEGSATPPIVQKITEEGEGQKSEIGGNFKRKKGTKRGKPHSTECLASIALNAGVKISLSEVEINLLQTKPVGTRKRESRNLSEKEKLAVEWRVVRFRLSSFGCFLITAHENCVSRCHSDRCCNISPKIAFAMHYIKGSLFCTTVHQKKYLDARVP